jgi:hypothetical protein
MLSGWSISFSYLPIHQIDKDASTGAMFYQEEILSAEHQSDGFARSKGFMVRTSGVIW